MKKLKQIPLLARIILAIVLGIGVGQFAPDAVARIMNTFCGVFSSLLGFIIPLIIVGLVAPAIARVGGVAGRMLVITTLLAYGFSVMSGLFSYGVSQGIFPHLLEGLSLSALSVEGKTLAPYFTIAIPPVMDVMTALVLAFMLGLGIATSGAEVLRKGCEEFETIVTRTISAVIIPLLPPYIFGLFLDMACSGKVGVVLDAFIKVIAVIFLLTLTLLLLQYTIAGLVTRRNPLRLLWTMLPAYFTALGTSSSAATIPVTLQRAKAAGVSEGVAGFVIPLCATIHLSGSMAKITACTLALMMLYGMPIDFVNILGFILMLAITMVAAPGVPGGAIMAALGVLSSIIGFDEQQQAMMVTLYIAMDSFGTACNVTGDATIALIVDKIYKRA